MPYDYSNTRFMIVRHVHTEVNTFRASFTHMIPTEQWRNIDKAYFMKRVEDFFEYAIYEDLIDMYYNELTSLNMNGFFAYYNENKFDYEEPAYNLESYDDIYRLIDDYIKGA